MEFDLSAALAYHAAHGVIETDNDIRDISSTERKEKLNSVIDELSADPANVLQSNIFDTLRDLVASLQSFTSSAQVKTLTDLLSGSLLHKSTQVAAESPEDLSPTSSHRTALEILAFFLYATTTTIQTGKIDLNNEETTISAKAKSKTKKQRDNQITLDIASLLEPAFDSMCRTMSLRASKLWPTTSERDAFISLFTKPAYLAAESETLMKNQKVKMRMFKIICIAIKHHGHAFGAQTTIVQNLQYFEHLSEPMAELLQVLSEQYDYPQLTDEILRELSNQEFNPNDNKGPKSVSSFLVRCSELLPRQILKQMTLLVKFLDCEAHVLRSAIIEVCGNLIISLCTADDSEASDTHKADISTYFDLLEERFLDANPYCRSKVLQVYLKICDLPKKYPKRRQYVCELATRSLEDRSSNVRRNAMKLLTRLIQTHQFDVLHGPTLSSREWQERLQQTQEELNILRPPIPANQAQQEPDSDLLEAPTSPIRKENGSSTGDRTLEEDTAQTERAIEKEQSINHLQMLKKFYTEANRFIATLLQGSNLVIQLLASKTKTEVIEAMDFFVVADAYRLDSARDGIRRMLHLIWTKSTSDEGKGVTTHLLECYKGLYVDAPPELSQNDGTNYIAKNLISLTYGATLAELTSLEQMLKIMMKDGLISDDVVNKLWQVFGVRNREISKAQRRGAIIVIGMLALANHEVIVNGLDVLLDTAFDRIGYKDLGLMKYACIALQRLGAADAQVKGELKKQTKKLSNSHGIFSKLSGVITTFCSSKEWFGVAEQALNAIFALAEHPDEICSSLIKSMTRSAFCRTPCMPSTPPRSRQESPSSDTGEEESPENVVKKEVSEADLPKANESRRLADLLFIVGHVAIKEIVHMEECEADFKRRKAELDSAKSKTVDKSDPAKDDLDQVTGASEDAFAEHMAYVREHELLFGNRESWLLSRYGSLVVDICKNNKRYPDTTLQSCATMALAKFMCVSGKYCEQNLPLLLLILEKSADPTTRSNLVIAMGDMTVCHNQVLDGCSDHLYARLSDSDPTVKKTCLMTLTFLVLAGQVKVKGQLGEMAKCLEDEDRRIADLARMFFTELSTKDNAIYNGFTDIFSLLSAGGEEEMDEEVFRRIIKFLMSFIERDRYAKQLAEKLAGRLTLCQTQRQFDDCAFALSCLPPTAKSETVQKAISDGWQFAVST